MSYRSLYCRCLDYYLQGFSAPSHGSRTVEAESKNDGSETASSPANVTLDEESNASQATTVHEGFLSDIRLSFNQDTNHSAKASTSVWQSESWRQVPILGIMSLTGVLTCTALAVLVLVASDGKVTRDWVFGLPPSVYLAITSVMANAFLAVALAEGIVISFWRTALRGCTITELNNNWLCGYSSRKAVFKGIRKGGRVTASATIFSMFSLLRGPLNQRASSVKSNVIYDSQGLLHIRAAQRLPEDYGGVAANSSHTFRPYETVGLTSYFGAIANQYSLRTKIFVNNTGCEHICNTSVKGFGFQPYCDTSKIHLVQAEKFKGEECRDNNCGSSGHLFDTAVTLYPTNSSFAENDLNGPSYPAGLKLNASFFEGEVTQMNSTAKAYNLTRRECKMLGRSVLYQVQIIDGELHLNPDWTKDQFLEDVPLLGPSATGGCSVVGGFQYAGDYMFSSQADASNYYDSAPATVLKGAFVNQLISNCTDTHFLQFHDPLDVMIGAMREIAFRASLQSPIDSAALDSNATTQQVPYAGTARHTIYVTDMWYMISAACISLISTAAVSATYYGWWELGRKVSMSPLEIAKAFDAPLLSDVGSNVKYDQIPGCMKGVRIRYGEKADRGRQPESASAVGEEDSGGDKWLVIGPEGHVIRPGKGARYR